MYYNNQTEQWIPDPNGSKVTGTILQWGHKYATIRRDSSGGKITLSSTGNVTESPADEPQWRFKIGWTIVSLPSMLLVGATTTLIR